MKTKIGSLVLFLLFESTCFNVDSISTCTTGCDLAVASYYVWRGASLQEITRWMKSEVVPNSEAIAIYNRDKLFNEHTLLSLVRLNIPFPCDCINGGEFLGHVFEYTIAAGDTYDLIATRNYAMLTTVELLRRFNGYDPFHLPVNGKLNVSVKCYCGDGEVSKDYGLFITYPLRPGDSLESIAKQTTLEAQLLQRYNPGVNFSQQSGLVFIPGKDQNGVYVPLYSSTGGLARGVIAGISTGGISGLLLLALCIHFVINYRKKNVGEVTLLPEDSVELSTFDVSGSAEYETSEFAGPSAGSTSGLKGIMLGNAVEFSYRELAKATNNFSLANKIGQGGFATVYHAKLRDEKTAIKKMDIEGSKEFMAELKILTHVHHLNLVRLIGYCVEGSLFLVYEYIDSGNLSHHLHASGRDPMPWSTRVQIALDSARGLEYIHEHTVPVYVHRDVKPANILIDKNFHAKVADFGLSQLIEVGGSSLHTGLVGTFGYMSPEYAQCGVVSPKIDVYAFGVVLYELISAKYAVVERGNSVGDSKAIVVLFEEVLSQPDPVKGIRKLVDPRLRENYPIDSVYKMAQLARACTQFNPVLRPSMRSIVFALMTLASSTEDCDVGS